MIQFMPQLRPEANEVALSCIISDMYNQVIGPDVNSNAKMKAVRARITGICMSYRLRTPASSKIITIAAEPQTIRVRLPNLAKRARPPNVAKKFAAFRIGVATPGATPKPFRMVFE